MKIGILTLFHGNYNWGGVLQGYALKSVLETNFENVEVDILKYHSKTNIIYSNKIQQAMQYSPTEVVGKLLHKFHKQATQSIEELLKNRKMLFLAFMSEFTTNPQVYNDDNLLFAAKEYDCLICGSDQIWNPNVARPGYFLDKIQGECRKISYAASIARDDLSAHERGVMIPLIEKFDDISVREKTAKIILERYMPTEMTVTEVLDPVLLLPMKEWSKFASPIKNQEKKYALAFFFSESYDYRKQIEKYCSQNNLLLKFIPFARQEYIVSDEDGDCERIYDVGPKEFVALFENAECVFTDSFHGSVFSILFNKQFCVFERDKNTKVSKNSRLYDLLEKFALSNRLIHDVRMLDDVLGEKINFQDVSNKLDKYRVESMAFLSQALSGVRIKNG